MSRGGRGVLEGGGREKAGACGSRNSSERSRPMVGGRAGRRTFHELTARFCRPAEERGCAPDTDNGGDREGGSVTVTGEGAEADLRSTCAYGVGMQTITENMSDPKFVESTCAKGEPGRVAQCIEGMVGVYINHYASIEPARTLCERLEPSNQPTCYRKVDSRAHWFRT